MKIDSIVNEFKKTEVAAQCALLIYTDYAAMWPSLREHFRGPQNLMDEIIHCESGEEKERLVGELQFQIGPLRSIRRVKNECL